LNAGVLRVAQVRYRHCLIQAIFQEPSSVEQRKCRQGESQPNTTLVHAYPLKTGASYLGCPAQLNKRLHGRPSWRSRASGTRAAIQGEAAPPARGLPSRAKPRLRHERAAIQGEAAPPAREGCHPGRSRASGTRAAIQGEFRRPSRMPPLDGRFKTGHGVGWLAVVPVLTG